MERLNIQLNVMCGSYSNRPCEQTLLTIWTAFSAPPSWYKLQKSISTEVYIVASRTSTKELFCEMGCKNAVVDVGISLFLTQNCKQLSLDKLILENFILFFTPAHPTCAFGNIELSFIYKTKDISVLLLSKECRWRATMLMRFSTNSTLIPHTLTKH